MQIIYRYLADNSHEMSSVIFSEKKELSAACCDQHLRTKAFYGKPLFDTFRSEWSHLEVTVIILSPPLLTILILKFEQVQVTTRCCV